MIHTGAYARRVVFNNKTNYHYYAMLKSCTAFSSRQFAIFTKLNSPKSLNVADNLVQSSNFRLFCSQTISPQVNGDIYIASRYLSLPEKADLNLYASFDQGELEEYIQSHLMQKFGFSEEDIDYLMHYNSNACLPLTHEKGGIVDKSFEYFSTNFGIPTAEMKEMILRYPILLRYEDLFIDNRLKLYKDLGINGEELTHEEISDIFRAAPFYLLCPISIYPRIIAEFKKYRFTKEETIFMFKSAPGLLGMKRGSIKAIFDLGKNLHLNLLFTY
jgi:hypothetical protein